MRREQKGVYSFNPANTAQLAKLDALYKEQLALYRFLNRPYGVLINTLVLPGLIHFLFCRENAWFHSWYLDLRNAFALPLYQGAKQELQGISHSAMLYIAASRTRVKTLKTIVKKMCEKLLLKFNSINECSDYLEKRYLEDPSGFPVFAEMKNVFANDITERVANYPSESINAINANAVYDLIAQLDPQKSSLQKILLINNRITNLLSKALTSHVIDPLQLPLAERLLQQSSLRFGMRRITQLIYASMSVTGAIGQKLILDPLFLKIRPGNRLVRGQRNSFEAEKEIKELTQTVRKLKQSANFNKTLARYALVFAIVLILYNFLINPIDSTPQMTLICLGIIATALKDGAQDFFDWRQSSQKNAYLLKFGKFLNKITEGMTAESWQYAIISDISTYCQDLAVIPSVILFKNFSKLQ